jgi:hypothetical protein
MKEQEAGETTQYEMSGACSKYWRGEYGKRFSFGKSERTKPLKRPMCHWEDNIKEIMGRYGLDSFGLEEAQLRMSIHQTTDDDHIGRNMQCDVILTNFYR